MAGRDDDDPWSRDRGPRYAGGAIRVGLPPRRRPRVLRRRPRCATRTWRSVISCARRHTSSTSRWSRSWPQAPCSTRAPGWPSGWSSSANSSPPQPDSIHPVVRDILRGGQAYTAVDAFAALQRLQELKATVGRLWQQMDVLVVPTIGTTFTVDEVLAARSTATRCSATTRTSATCSTCSAWRYRSASPPTAGRTARCCSAPL